jgi:NitT/TauT family transport system permease protein
MTDFWKRIWGGAIAAESGLSRLWVDALVLVGLLGLGYGVVHLAGQWNAPSRHATEIVLSPSQLPWYTFASLSRGLAAYALSLAFTFVYGYWAAKDRRAERILVPLLDILQSIPVLGFMPGLVIALVALFPSSNVGLELAAILMIFTGQVWNMTFSFYRSLQTVPREMHEAASVFGFTWWQRLRRVEIPSATVGLIWNSMMSMAGGWFFLTISEAFQLGDEDYRLPGLGAYMSVAQDQGDGMAKFYGVIAMIVMIVVLDQILWRPLVAWGRKFRVEDQGGGEVASSWFLDALRRSWIAGFVGASAHRLIGRFGPHSPQTTLPPMPGHEPAAPSRLGRWLSLLPLVALVALMVWGTIAVADIIRRLPSRSWLDIAEGTGATLARVVVATALGTLWTVPAGLAIGLSPRLSRVLQPIVQIAASFPAPMLFATVLGVLGVLGVPLGLGSLVLMVMGTQWYILFNVIAGASTIPADLREAATTYRILGWQRFRTLYLPAIFPFLVTGWVTAMGGAWNASIVSEYVTYQHQVHSTIGLGALISAAADQKDMPLLAASVATMAVVVVGINRTLWRRLYRVAETRYALNK